MSIRERIAATVAPAIDCQAPYAKVMIAKLVDITDDHAKRHVAEIERLKAWVADLQSGMYVNCVYCGHRYGPGETTPVSMADALKAHVAVCPEHPMAALLMAAQMARRMFLDLERGIAPSRSDFAKIEAAIAKATGTK